MTGAAVGPGNHAQASTTTDLPKTVREDLCLAQAALSDRIRAGLDVERCRSAIEQIGTLIDRVDEHRPVGVNGKHGDRHTGTCGCEDPPGNRQPWSIDLYPRPADGNSS